MDYITRHYKLLSEQLTARVNYLNRILIEMQDVNLNTFSASNVAGPLSPDGESNSPPLEIPSMRPQYNPESGPPDPNDYFEQPYGPSQRPKMEDYNNKDEYFKALKRWNDAKKLYDRDYRIYNAWERKKRQKGKQVSGLADYEDYGTYT